VNVNSKVNLGKTNNSPEADSFTGTMQSKYGHIGNKCFDYHHLIQISTFSLYILGVVNLRSNAVLYTNFPTHFFVETAGLANL